MDYNKKGTLHEHSLFSFSSLHTILILFFMQSSMPVSTGKYVYIGRLVGKVAPGFLFFIKKSGLQCDHSWKSVSQIVFG